ncbi:hypothetical protein OF83DRAFT_264663 [Amylostereum chailletii]|nr:hypothetical protein OF83DRAFT_264663 [Amylostereum chailletii]
MCDHDWYVVARGRKTGRFTKSTPLGLMLGICTMPRINGAKSGTSTTTGTSLLVIHHLREKGPQSASAPPRMGTGTQPSRNEGVGQSSSPQEPHTPRNGEPSRGTSHPGSQRRQPAGTTPRCGPQQQNTVPPQSRASTSTPPRSSGTGNSRLSTPPATPMRSRRDTNTSSAGSSSSPSTCVTQVEPGPPTPPQTRPASPESDSDHAFDPNLSSPDTGVSHLGPPRPRARPPFYPSTPSRRRVPAQSDAQASDADIESESDLPSHETLASNPRTDTPSRTPAKGGVAGPSVTQSSEQNISEQPTSSPRSVRARTMPIMGTRSSPRLAAKKAKNMTEENAKNKLSTSSLSSVSSKVAYGSQLRVQAHQDSSQWALGSPSRPRGGHSRLQTLKVEEESPPRLSSHDKGKGRARKPQAEESSASASLPPVDLTISDDDMFTIPPETVSTPSTFGRDAKAVIVQEPVSFQDVDSSDTLDDWFTPPSSESERAPEVTQTLSSATHLSFPEDVPVPAPVTMSSHSSRSAPSPANLQRAMTEGAVDTYRMPVRHRISGASTSTTPLRRSRTEQANALRSDLVSPRHVPLPASPAADQNQVPPSRVSPSWLASLSPSSASRIRSPAYPVLSDLDSPMTHLSSFQSSYRSSEGYATLARRFHLRRTFQAMFVNGLVTPCLSGRRH